eukprot:6784990-Prymnesium_polylepis.1
MSRAFRRRGTRTSRTRAPPAGSAAAKCSAATQPALPKQHVSQHHKCNRAEGLPNEDWQFLPDPLRLRCSFSFLLATSVLGPRTRCPGPTARASRALTPSSLRPRPPSNAAPGARATHSRGRKSACGAAVPARAAAATRVSSHPPRRRRCAAGGT